MNDILKKIISISGTAVNCIATAAMKEPSFFLAFCTTGVLCGFKKKQYKMQNDYELQFAFEKEYPLFYKILKSYEFINAIKAKDEVVFNIEQIRAIIDKNNKTDTSVLLQFIRHEESESISCERKSNGDIIMRRSTIQRNIVAPSDENYDDLLQAIERNETSVIYNFRTKKMEEGKLEKTKNIKLIEADSKLLKENFHKKSMILSFKSEGIVITEKTFDSQELKEVEMQAKDFQLGLASNKIYSEDRKVELAREEEDIRKVLLHLEKKYKCLPLLNLILACYNYGAGMGMIYEKVILLTSNLLFIYAFLSYCQFSKGIIAGVLSSTTAISSIFLWVLKNNLFHKYYEEVKQDKEKK